MRIQNPTISGLWEVPAGTVISTSRGLYNHVGLLTEPTPGRERSVLSLNPGRQVCEESLSAFSRGNPVKVEATSGRLPWPYVKQRAQSGQHPPYSWLNFNCEHFVRFAHGLPPESPQLKVVAAFGAVAALALAST